MLYGLSAIVLFPPIQLGQPDRRRGQLHGIDLGIPRGSMVRGQGRRGWLRQYLFPLSSFPEPPRESQQRDDAQWHAHSGANGHFLGVIPLALGRPGSRGVGGGGGIRHGRGGGIGGFVVAGQGGDAGDGGTIGELKGRLFVTLDGATDGFVVIAHDGVAAEQSIGCAAVEPDDAGPGTRLGLIYTRLARFTRLEMQDLPHRSRGQFVLVQLLSVQLPRDSPHGGCVPRHSLLVRQRADSGQQCDVRPSS